MTVLPDSRRHTVGGDDEGGVAVNGYLMTFARVDRAGDRVPLAHRDAAELRTGTRRRVRRARRPRDLDGLDLDGLSGPRWWSR